ncbi:MAG: ATP-binding protein [Hylemonella sp.]
MGLLAFAMQSRRTGKAALRIALVQQQAMLNNETAGIVQVRDRRIFWANRAFELMMGYGPGEMNGMSTRDNYPDEESYRAFGEACYPVLAAGGTYRAEIKHRRKDGSIIHLDISGHRLGNSKSETIWTMVDISDRVAAQNRLKELSESRLALSEARLKRMVALSKAWYWETDSELRFTVMGNSRTEPEHTPLPLGRFRALTLGKRRWEIEGIEAISETWEEHRARLAARQTFLDFEYTIREGDEQRWVQISGEPMFDSNGQFTGYSGVGKDVTAERLAEKQLREMQKAELIGQLTGGLAHDFRNMLNVVLGSLDQLEEALAQKGVTSLGPLATARTAALNGVGVTDSLLSVARQQPLKLQRYDLNVLIGEMEPLVKTAVGGSVRVILDLLPQALSVKVDAAGLSNVILNLAVNARDAMQGQPREQVITLRSQRTNLSDAIVAQNMGLGPGEYAVLEVSDSGPGMSQEVLSKAFNPFFTTKPPGKGTGLGLSMVHGFAQQLGGKASIRTELGVGTTISIYLPLESGEAVQEKTPPTATPGPLGGAHQPLRVLVVDDQAELCELACTWLESLGHRPLGSHSAEEALGQIEPGRFDVLFTDVMMPAGMDGITLAREGQRRDPGLQVVFASGNTAVIPRGAKGQPERAVAKPYRKSDLLKVFGSTR